ncbi:MAG: hypothetical protein EB078_10545 [Proteobacteria bacterium]|nr:hypothetical protein [Pseudomonadota bacterium]
MGWLQDLDYEYIYNCVGHEFLMRGKAGDDMPRSAPCPTCGQTGQYAGFKPIQVKQTTEIEFDQNGRKAVAIKNKDGSTTYISKTKLHYMKTGRIENQYTRSYQEHLQKTQQDEMLRTEHSRKRANVSPLKNLPDGEYVSDGVNFYRAPEK